MLKKMHPLFIGFGNQAKEYANVLQKYKIKIQSVCVTNIKKNKKTFDKYKILNRYETIEKALNEKKFNCIFIFLPFDLIEKKILKILELSDTPVYCEKPIALNYKKICKIEKYVKKNNKKLFVLYNRNYYNNFHIIKKFLLRENFFLTAYIPEKINLTIKNINKNLKGNIKYHLTSHWIIFFFSLQKSKNVQPKFINRDIIFRNKNIDILIYPNGKGFITAIFKSRNYILILLTLEKLLVYKIYKEKIKFLKYYDEFAANNFKPGVENLVRFILKKNIISNISNVKSLYNSIRRLNY